MKVNLLIKKALKDYLFIFFRRFWSSKVCNKYFFHHRRRRLTQPFCGAFIEKDPAVILMLTRSRSNSPKLWKIIEFDVLIKSLKAPHVILLIR